MDTLFNVLSACAILITVPFMFKLWKQAFINTTVVTTRTTDDGESLTVQASFSSLTSYEDRHNEIQKLMEHADRRKDFTDRRFKARLDEDIAAREGKTALKSV